MIHNKRFLEKLILVKYSFVQEGKKYKIELLKMENYEGSKLIIKGTNSSDTGESCRNFGCKLSVIFQGGIVARSLPVSRSSGTTWKSKVFPIPIPTFPQSQESLRSTESWTKGSLWNGSKISPSKISPSKRRPYWTPRAKGFWKMRIASQSPGKGWSTGSYALSLTGKLRLGCLSQYWSENIFSDLVDKIQLEKGYLRKPRSEDTH